LNKIAIRLNFSPIFRKVNKLLIEKANNDKPDIIWIFKGLHITPETLIELRRNFFLANYNPDHPYIIAGRGSGNHNVKNSVGLYHLHLCYHSILQNQIEKEFKIPTRFLPFGYQLGNEQYERINRVKDINKLCFIGNPDAIRINTINYLASNGIKIDLYGHGWSNTSLNGLENVSTHDALYGIKFWEKLRSYRLQLNIFRDHNVGSHNMRTFEIPAVGGIQLAPYSDEQAQFFLEDEEIFYYRNNDELLKKVRFILNLDLQTANHIRDKARNRSTSSMYNYQNRAKQVLDFFNEFINP